MPVHFGLNVLVLNVRDARVVEIRTARAHSSKEENQRKYNDVFVFFMLLGVCPSSSISKTGSFEVKEFPNYLV